MANESVDSSFDGSQQYLRGERNDNERRFIKRETLTDNVQINRVALNWLRRHLTVIAAGVALLDPFYLQRPLVGRPVMCCLEAEVSRVSVCADG